MKFVNVQLFSICVSVFIFMLTQANCSKSPIENKPDLTPPNMVLAKTSFTIDLGDTIEYPQCFAIDDVDGSISDKIARSSNVNNTKPGKYLVEYSVCDKNKNTAIAICTVEVKLPTSTVLYLPLDGEITDKSKNGLIATNKGAVLVNDRFGNAHSAFHFDGSSCVEFAYNDLFSNPSSFAVSLWAKSDIMGNKYNDEGFIFDFGFVAERGYGIRLHMPQAKVTPYYNGLPTVIDSIPMLDTLWHHYVLQYNGSQITYFVDGKKVIEQKSALGTIDKYPLRIGAQSKSLSRYWNGAIDDILLLSTVLTDIQIKNLSKQSSIAGASENTGTDSSDTKKPDSSSILSSISGMKAEITGVSGNLQLKLSWNAVPGVLGYGVYYKEGSFVTKNDNYRVAANNYKTFSPELAENKQYTFAVTYNKDGDESEISKSMTITFKLP